MNTAVFFQDCASGTEMITIRIRDTEHLEPSHILQCLVVIYKDLLAVRSGGVMFDSMIKDNC